MRKCAETNDFSPILVPRRADMGVGFANFAGDPGSIVTFCTIPPAIG